MTKIILPALCAIVLGFPALACGQFDCGGSSFTSSSAGWGTSGSFGGGYAVAESGSSFGGCMDCGSGAVGFAETTFSGTFSSHGAAGYADALNNINVNIRSTTVGGAFGHTASGSVATAERTHRVLSYEDGWRHASGDTSWYDDEHPHAERTELRQTEAPVSVDTIDPWPLVEKTGNMLMFVLRLLLLSIAGLVTFVLGGLAINAGLKTLRNAVSFQQRFSSTGACEYCGTKHAPGTDCRNCGAPEVA